MKIFEQNRERAKRNRKIYKIKLLNFLNKTNLSKIQCNKCREIILELQIVKKLSKCRIDKKEKKV